MVVIQLPIVRRVKRPDRAFSAKNNPADIRRMRETQPILPGSSADFGGRSKLTYNAFMLSVCAGCKSRSGDDSLHQGLADLR
jgi:hypothetical protein